jgi:hypothetical protein
MRAVVLVFSFLCLLVVEMNILHVLLYCWNVLHVHIVGMFYMFILLECFTCSFVRHTHMCMHDFVIDKEMPEDMAQLNTQKKRRQPRKKARTIPEK